MDMLTAIGRLMENTLKDLILRNIDFEGFYFSSVNCTRKKQLRNNNIVVICPFHDDTTPSLSIDLATGNFYCFGCSQGGSIFDFYMKLHNCSFKEALLELGDLTGISDDVLQ